MARSLAVPFLLFALWLIPAAAADSGALIGVWILDAADSKSESGQLPRRETRTYRTLNTEGTLTLLVEGVASDGMPYAYGATGDLNGMEYPIPGRDEGARILGDRISWERIDPNTVEMKIKKKGEIINTTRHSVSKDGRTLTVTENGIDADGKPVHATRIYVRR